MVSEARRLLRRGLQTARALAMLMLSVGCGHSERESTTDTVLLPTGGSWHRVADLPTPRTGAAVFAWDGRIYVIGGQQNSRFLATNEFLDVDRDRWSAEPPIRLARSFSSANMAAIDGSLYVVAGNPRGYCTNAADAFDTRAHTWRLLPAAPVARCHAAVVAANGSVYAIGGWNTSSTVHYTAIDRYDPRDNRWRPDATLPRARGGMAAGVVGTTIVLVGGWTPDEPLATSVDRYDVLTRRWSRGAPLSIPRTATATAVLGSRLYVIGGLAMSNGKLAPTSIVESYDIETNSWRRETPLPIPLAYAGAATIGGAIYVTGGFSTGENPEPRSWMYVPAKATSAPGR
jgi:N-acetylneuraminic acid mutarotase